VNAAFLLMLLTIDVAIVDENYLTETLAIIDPVLIPQRDPQRILGAASWRRALVPGQTYRAESRRSAASIPPTPVFGRWTEAASSSSTAQQESVQLRPSIGFLAERARESVSNVREGLAPYDGRVQTAGRSMMKRSWARRPQEIATGGQSKHTNYRDSTRHLN
jgi:hypothetical protein